MVEKVEEIIMMGRRVLKEERIAKTAQILIIKSIDIECKTN